MMTEKAFAPYVFPVDISDRKGGVEVRGIWEISGFSIWQDNFSYLYYK